MRYEKMSKEQLINELLDRGINIFTDLDSKETLIEALYQEDEFESEYSEAEVHRAVKKSEWL